MPMTPETWEYLESYSRQVFGSQDDHLAGLMTEAVAAGLPDIAVSPEVGRFLMIMTSMTRGRLAIEVGTLGGYSGIWIARGLRPDGRLLTIEANPVHADFARRQFEAADVADRIEILTGSGLDVLSALAEEIEPGALDILFLDASKSEYTEFFEMARPLIPVGGLVLADNVYGIGAGWIDEGYGTDDFNRLIAADPDFEAVAFPLRQGVLVARRFS